MKLYSLKKGLKRARKAAGYTQTELAHELGVHDKTIKNWEQGISDPTLKTLISLSKLYDCDLDYLIGRIDCRTHDAQFIQDYTGLSEDSIEWLHEYHNTKTDGNNCIPTYLSNIIDHDDFSLLMTRIKMFLGYAFWDGFIGSAEFMDTDIGQSAYLWHISQTFTRIVEDLGCKHRNKLGIKDNK